MKTIIYNDESITIMWEKRKLFSSKIMTEKEDVLINEIAEVSRNELEGKLDSISIIMKENAKTPEHFITIEEYPELEKMYEFLVNKKEAGNGFKITIFDIGTVL